MDKGSMNKRTAFTLIELLVVIAIIAVLMGILMPSLQRVRKQARSVICKANLKQWGAVWHMYLGDNNDRFPLRYGNKGRWIDALWSFYKNDDFRLCPSAVKPANPTGDTSGGDDWGNTFYAWGKLKPDNDRPESTYGSYGMNEWVNTPGISSSNGELFGGPASWYYKTSNIRQANQIPLFADAIFFSVHPRNGDTVPTNDPGGIINFPNDRSTDNSMGRMFINRHEGAINMLFMDYSVDRVKLKRLFGYRWHAEYVINADIPAQWPDWLAGFPE